MTVEHRTSADSLVAELEQFAATAPNSEALMTHIVQRLSVAMPHYNWTGFYMLDPQDHAMLVLGPFVGAPTPHVRIPMNQGICGAAASSGQTVVVDDVSADPRYLSCSIETKSEIVAPVFVHGEVVGELDIDSHTPSAFLPEDVTFVEACAAIVGRYLERGAPRS